MQTFEIGKTYQISFCKLRYAYVSKARHDILTFIVADGQYKGFIYLAKCKIDELGEYLELTVWDEVNHRPKIEIARPTQEVKE